MQPQTTQLNLLSRTYSHLSRQHQHHLSPFISRTNHLSSLLCSYGSQHPTSLPLPQRQRQPRVVSAATASTINVGANCQLFRQQIPQRLPLRHYHPFSFTSSTAARTLQQAAHSSHRNFSSSTASTGLTEQQLEFHNVALEFAKKVRSVLGEGEREKKKTTAVTFGIVVGFAC